jgi:hypothetical protein
MAGSVGARGAAARGLLTPGAPRPLVPSAPISGQGKG